MIEFNNSKVRGLLKGHYVFEHATHTFEMREWRAFRAGSERVKICDILITAFHRFRQDDGHKQYIEAGIRTKQDKAIWAVYVKRYIR